MTRAARSTTKISSSNACPEQSDDEIKRRTTRSAFLRPQFRRAPFEFSDEPCADRFGQSRKPTLLGFVFAPAFGGLNRDGLQADSGKVIRAGAHIHRPRDVRELEGVRGELRGDPWLRLHRPLEEIHGDVHAAGLLVVDARFEGGRDFVQRPRARREKAEGVVMRATHGHRAHDSIRTLCPEPQRPGAMATLFGLAIDHRPFMQAEAAVERRTGRDCPAEPQAEIQTASLRCVGQGHPHESISASQEAAVSDKLVRLGQRDTGARRPTSDGREAKWIIGEEKIFDGVTLTLLRSSPTGFDESIRTRLVRGTASPPFGRPSKT